MIIPFNGVPKTSQALSSGMWYVGPQLAKEAAVWRFGMQVLTWGYSFNTCMSFDHGLCGVRPILLSSHFSTTMALPRPCPHALPSYCVCYPSNILYVLVGIRPHTQVHDNETLYDSSVWKLPAAVASPEEFRAQGLGSILRLRI